jgi:hypothetical protein
MPQDGKEPGANVTSPECSEPAIGAKISFLRQIFGVRAITSEVIGGPKKRACVHQGQGGEIRGTALLG